MLSKKTLRYAASMILLCLLATFAHGQILDYQNKIGITLSDGTPVTLYGRASNSKIPGKDDYEFTGDYYYLPVNMRLSRKDDGTPQFLLLKYTTDEKTDAGGVQGALMHFLMEWGLTPAQERELDQKVKEKVKELSRGNALFARVSAPKVMGAVDLTAEKDNSFRVISAVLNDASMTPKLISSGKAPVIEGAKVAVASKLDKNGAQLLAATLEKSRSISDVSLEMSFKYSLLFPAVRGKIIVDWSKFQTAFEHYSAKYKHDDKDSKDGDDDTYSYDEVKHIYESAIETKAVDIQIDKNTTDDAVANKVVEEFMNVMINALTETNDQNEKPQPAKEEEKQGDPNIRYGKEYRFSKTKFESHYSRKYEVYNLSYRIAIPKEVVITENLASWYDGVRNNKKCVASVNLNDKFFQHRDINLILSEGSEQLIGKEVNYVTVNVRKKRNDGNDFFKSVTVDKEYLKKNGVRTNLTYARGEDTNSEVYEYQAQWSFNDGDVYPEPSPWIKGSWEGLALTVPVKPRTIEMEANLDDLKAAGITRATLQMRYMKLGKEVETNIPLTVSKSEALIKSTIFTDPSTRGYAYRLVFNHKEAGKLATEWDAKINDDYVYVNIPEEFKDKTSEAFLKAIEIGKEITEEANGEVSPVAKVLDKFKDVIGIVNN
jgi:Na+-transporting NADH:ubiquinone oxidoreductase subunit NqrC